MASALNLSAEFDRLFEAADSLLKKHNPCAVCKGADGVHCFASRVKDSGFKKNALCCGGCKHHNPDKGCTAHKPLACKLWLCHTLAPQFPELAKQLLKIEKEATSLHLWVFRGDKDTSLKNAERMSSKNILKIQPWRRWYDRYIR